MIGRWDCYFSTLYASIAIKNPSHLQPHGDNLLSIPVLHRNHLRGSLFIASQVGQPSHFAPLDYNHNDVRRENHRVREPNVPSHLVYVFSLSLAKRDTVLNFVSI